MNAVTPEAIAAAIAVYSFKPIPGVMNPHEPGRDRSGYCGRDVLCRYCACEVNDDPRVYLGEKHEDDCPIAPYVRQLEAEATGQPSLLQVLDEVTE